MSQENDKVAVGHEWSDDAKVVLTGKQFRQIINLMNQYPQMLAQVFQNFFEQSSDLFAKVAEELEVVVKDLEESGDARPIYREEFELRMKEAMDKQKEEAPNASNTEVNPQQSN
jgi:hypothetical protein